MSFVWGLVLGALVGVLIERLVGHPFDHLILKPTLALLRRSRIRRLNSRLKVSGEVSIIRDSALFVHQFVSNGLDSKNLIAQMASEPVTLKERHEQSSMSQHFPLVSDLSSRIDSWAMKLEADPHFWNGTSLALYRCDVSRTPRAEEPVLVMQFREENYATFCAIDEIWQSIGTETRRSFDGDRLRQVDPLLSNCFGINCTVETADGQVLLTTRSTLARSWASHSHISFNEGLSSLDRRPGGVVDVLGAFERGFQEEIGVSIRELPDFFNRLVIHSLVLDVDRYQWALLAHLNLENTSLTSSKLSAMRSLGAATDDWEASDVRFISFSDSPTAVLSELKSSRPWVAHGLLNLALSAIHRHPASADEIRDAVVSLD